MATLFDENGNTTITESVVQKDADGKDITAYTTRNISAEQLEKHLPMVEAKMTVSEKAQAAEIIQGQKEGVE
jgi:hypothetical protein